MTDATKPSDGFDYYQGTVFWTSFQRIEQLVNTKISGSPMQNWVDHTVARYGNRKRALVVNCGNGWVERSFYNRGGLEHVTGFDILGSNIDEARRAAPRSDWEYIQGDCNTIERLGTFDLIINCGSMHHVAKIERLTQILADSLTDDGIYVSYDYVGAHRNQFGWDAWSRALLANEALPERYRVAMRYPHMPTILAVDPTEAIHAELQMETMGRYFDFVERTDAGGGVAYMVLFQNHALLRDQHTAEGIQLIEELFAKDQAELKRDAGSNLFSYVVARPNLKKISPAERKVLLQSEDQREGQAANNAGRYYSSTPLELIYNELGMAEYKLRINNIA